MTTTWILGKENPSNHVKQERHLLKHDTGGFFGAGAQTKCLFQNSGKEDTPK